MYKIILGIILIILSSFIGMIIEKIRIQQKVDAAQLSCQRFSAIINAYSTLVENEISITKYLANMKCSKIAIYGYGKLGKSLWEILQKEGVRVACIIDKNSETILNDTNIPVHRPDDILPEIDIIIVTAVFYFDEIKYEMMKKVSCPIISIEEMVEDEQNKNSL